MTIEPVITPILAPGNYGLRDLLAVRYKTTDLHEG